MRIAFSLVALGLTFTACKAGGTYVDQPRRGGADRGETNGRSFDFVSTKPDGDEWTIRFRGSAMWVAYSMDEKSDEVGNFNLTPKEVKRVWDLVDNLDLPGRRAGYIDDAAGTVLFRLREPGGEDGGHESYTIYVSRDTDDEDVIAIADYLRKVVKLHTGEKPNF